VVRVTGWRYAILFGLPLRGSAELDIERIRNVEHDGTFVRLDVQESGGDARMLLVRFEDSPAATTFVAQLPTVRAPGFSPRLLHHVAFESDLGRTGALPWATSALVVLIVSLFAWSLLAGAPLLRGDGSALVPLGSNFGPFTTAGDWWRLITGTVLHSGAIHLLVNLWALAAHGPLLERLIGPVRLLWIYIASAVAGSLASVSWAPDVNSVGASGAVFGVLAALLVTLWRNTRALQGFVVKPLLVSSSTFTTVALIGGVVVDGVDNAAHFGGLVCGALIALTMPGPADQSKPSNRSWRLLAAGMVSLLVVVVGTASATWRSNVLTGDAHFAHVARWIERNEAVAVNRRNVLFDLAQKEAVDDAEFAQRLETDIIPIWNEASAKLESVELPKGSRSASQLRYLKEFTGSRAKAFALCANGVRADNQRQVDACLQELARGDALAKQAVASRAPGAESESTRD
jgi:rhomboid protease GluP